MIKRVLLLFCLAFQSLLLAASDRYRVYDVSRGLSENSILDMFQDVHGYMWFATKDGLNRFNGYTFDVFRKNIDGVNLKIDAVLSHRDGCRIWVGSDYKLLLFDPRDESFVVDPVLDVIAGVQGLCYDDSDLWVAAESGVWKWDGAGEPKRYEFPQSPEGYFSRVVMKDSSGNLWVSLGSSIYRYIKESDMFIPHPIPVSNEITALAEYEGGSLLVGTDGGDIFLFSISGGRQFVRLSSIDSRIHDFHKENTGGRNILVGSDAGLYLYDPTRRSLTRSEDALGHESVYKFYVDREGALWVGSYFSGVFYRQPRHKEIAWYYDDGTAGSLKGSAVSDICEDPEGNLWIATETGGLNRLDVRTQKIKDYTSLSFNNIHALCLDGDKLYIGTFSRGMDVLDVRTGKVTRNLSDPYRPGSIVNDYVYSIFKASDGTVYVGTLKGVCTYDPKRGTFTEIKELESCFICDIAEDRHGNIWCAEKNNGVYCLSAQTGEWRSWNYPQVPSNRICGIFVDRDSEVWLCTNGAGVCRYNREEDRFVSLSSDSEIPGVCYQMLQDDAGFYWVSSNSGLFRFGPNADKIKFYTVEDGLQSNQFNYNSALKTSDGRLWFGGVNGLNSLDPLNILENTVRPQVRIASVTTASKDAFGKSERLMVKESEVRIPHDITSFEITFDVLSHIAPDKNRVAYMIDEINETWDYSRLRTISLVKPSPGTYTLRVKACNNDGYWSEEAILKMVVLPHPLESLPAKVIYVLLFICLALLVYKILDRNIKRRKEEELRIIELNNERESVQSKMTFFTNVAHEIKTPVTLISSPLDRIIETGEWNEEVEANLHLMKKNSDRLLSLVRQLLDFRKIEKDSFKLTFSTTDVNIIVSETVERFRLMRPDVDIKVNLSDESPIVNADAEALVKVVSNLLTNAVKYTRDSIEVRVSLEDGNAVKLSVSDNGPGIPAEQHSKIFDMFYQINPGKANGFGVGLSLVKHLVELHGGRIYVNGDYREGCQMVVELPDNISPEPEVKMADPETSDICVLVVEDTKDMQDFIAGNIGKEYSVLRADNGAEALKILEDYAVDIILSDLYMPEVDGFELLEKVRSSQQTSHIPFILLTAQDSMSSKIKSLEYGADAYIEKPFSLEHVRAAVNNLISRRDRIHKSFQTSLEISMDNERMAGQDSEWLSKVNALILKNISNDTYNIDELAGDMSVSRTVLQRKLKGLTGSTPNDYIRLIRLKKAAELLSQGGYRVNEVCYLVGFNSPSYFTKCFVKQFGVKPKNFQTTSKSQNNG